MIQLEPGLLVGNDEPKVDALEKIKLAIALFERKFKHRPDVVYVNPIQHTGQMQIGRVRVMPLKTVQPNTFWVGVEPDTLWMFCNECMTRTDHEKRGDRIVCLECEKRKYLHVIDQKGSSGNPSAVSSDRP